MNRRDLITLVGGADGRWQHERTNSLPVIGFVSSESPELFADSVRVFRQGLSETGYVEGQNLVLGTEGKANRRLNR